MAPKGWKYSEVESCYMPPKYWKAVRTAMEKFVNKNRKNIVQVGAGDPSSFFKKKSKNPFKKTKTPLQQNRKDPMYEENFKNFVKGDAKTFQQCKNFLS
jgi:hypothetical protein